MDYTIGSAYSVFYPMLDAMDWSRTKSFDQKVCSCTAKSIIDEQADKCIVRVLIPGASKQAIDIEVSNYDATLTVTVKQEKDESKGQYVAYDVVRKYALTRDVNEDQVTSQYVDGVLSITLPFSESSKPKKVFVG